MDNNNLDELIRDTYIEFNEETDIYSNLDIPDFDNVIGKFHNNIQEDSNNQALGKRLAKVASFVIAVLITTIVSPISQVDAFKLNMVKVMERLRGDAIDISLSTADNSQYDSLNSPKSNEEIESNGEITSNSSTGNDKPDQVEKLVSIEEVKKEVPFEILSPQYLPDGYKLKEVKLIQASGNTFIVLQRYTNGGQVDLKVIQTTILPGTVGTTAFSASFRRKYLHINGLNITSYTDDKNFKNNIWIKNNIKFEVSVPYSVTDKQMEKIIKSLK